MKIGRGGWFRRKQQKVEQLFSALVVNQEHKESFKKKKKPVVPKPHSRSPELASLGVVLSHLKV